jgi:tetratricopeptide (TPR) repeat protein
MMDLSDALRLNPDYVEARALRGVVNYESDRWDRALEDFNFVLARRPTDGQALLGRGVIYLKREDLARAGQDFRRFLKAHPADPLAPKLRELVASLGPSAPAEEPHVAAAPERPTAAVRTRTATRASTPSLQKLADDLFRQNALTDQYGRKVLRGQRGHAVGDIGTAPASQPASGKQP